MWFSNGEFDRIMLRPAGTLFQTFASKIEFSSVGRLLQAVVILAYAIWSSGIRWTIQGVLLLLFMILCGIFLFMGLYIIYATLCFFYHRGAGVHEHLHGRRKRIRTISCRHLRKFHIKIPHLHRPSGLLSILSPAYSFGKKQPEALCCRSHRMPYILRPLLHILEGRSKQI